MRKVDLSKVKRVLVIRPGAIGDVLLTTPFIRALKKAIPNTKIDYLVEPFAGKLIEKNPYIDSIIYFEKKKLKKAGAFVKMEGSLKLYNKLIINEYDLVFDLFGNLRTALFSLITGARYRVGFTFRGRKYLYNIRIKPDPEPKYNVYYHMDLLKGVGIKTDGEQLDLILDDKEKGLAADFFKKTASFIRVIGINPAGTWITKKWQNSSFIEAGRLILEDSRACLVVLWGPGEEKDADEIINGLGDTDRVFKAPETDIRGLAAIVSGLTAMITNDGAGKHIAVAVNTPTVTVFGPTNYRSWGPEDSDIHRFVVSGLDCSPCDRTVCPDRDIECMKSISPGKVVGELKEILKHKT